MEWKTIDSAPKDGTVVLACKLFHTGKFSFVFPARFIDFDLVGDSPGWEAFTDQGTFTADPTHWMPLPPPPSQEPTP